MYNDYNVYSTKLRGNQQAFILAIWYPEAKRETQTHCRVDNIWCNFQINLIFIFLPIFFVFFKVDFDGQVGAILESNALARENITSLEKTGVVSCSSNDKKHNEEMQNSLNNIASVIL